MGDEGNISLDDIKKDLFDALNIKGASDSDKKVLAEKMYKAVESKAISRFMNEATDQQKNELDELTAKNDPALIDKFIEDNFDIISKFFQEEALNLRNDLIAKFGK